MALALDDFIRRLDDSGAMTVTDVTAFLGSLSADAKPTDGEQLAKRLVKDR